MFTYKTRTLSLTRLCRDIIQVRWKTFTLLYDKFAQDDMYQILSELAMFYTRYHKQTFWCFFGSQCIITCMCVCKCAVIAQ